MDALRDGWEKKFELWFAPFDEAFRHKTRRVWAPLYVRGLIAPGDRKSVEPMAARIAPRETEQLHHFVATSKWETAPIEEALYDKADALVGGDDAFLIVDDTALPKKGTESVGVAHQYCGALGKQANCQSLVSLTLARGEVPVPVALRLYLPEAWANDPARRAKAKVPESVGFRPKWKIALEEIKRVREHGVSFGAVLADAGYGACAEFRRGLSEMQVAWAVGIQSTQLVYPEHARVRVPRASAKGGRPRTRGVPTHVRRSVKAVIAQLGDEAWQTVTWRSGTKGALKADFAAVRVCVADGDKTTDGVHLPGEPAWLVAERRGEGVFKYYLTNNAEGADLTTLAASIKARWSCELAHQQMKEELGLDHFEGRSWHGLHHHAVLTMVAFAFLQHHRVRAKKD
ncbi:MAG: IS701 family transposase [Hyphomicrobiales bacterium]|nr:MAG: IS701 family transposase [Hyphomicrobiales bacterium]